MIIGTAGHIDHGKTTLVRALTGVDTDRLKEEKERGISIELGYAYVPRANGGMLGFVDVPGHERLIHTMVAGATGIDFALLVIAADDGVMPQTREHLAIVDLLGVTRGAVAITKTDRVDAAQLANVRAEIDAALAGTSLHSAPTFAVDALREGDAGIAALRAHLHDAATLPRERRDDAGLFRLAIDRVFSLPGHGTIATGTVHAGTIRIGDIVQIMPTGSSARVRGIHSNNRDAATGAAGQRCAINLAGVDKTQLMRGDWLADPRAFLPSARADVTVRLRTDGADLRNWATVHVHLGTADHLAHLVPLDTEAIAAGQSARAQLVFATPVCAATGDRFVVRDAQAQRTLGGGRVLDANAPSRKRRSASRMAYLDAIEHFLASNRIDALLQHAPYGFARAELERICATPSVSLVLPSAARTIETRQGAVIVADECWRSLADAAISALRTFHAQFPDDAGPDVSRLRRIAAPMAPDGLWRARIDDLLADSRIARSGTWLHLPEHRVALSASETQLAQRLLPLIGAGTFDPPWLRDLATTLGAVEADARRTLRKLSSTGAVHQIVPDLFYGSDRLRELAAIFAELARATGDVEAAAFRDRVGLGRKRAIQLLEFFDRVGYTRRVRNAHRLRENHEGFI